MPLLKRRTTPPVVTQASYRTEGHPAVQAIIFTEANDIFVKEFKYSYYGQKGSDGSKLHSRDFLPDGFTVLRQYDTPWKQNVVLARREDAVLLIEASANSLSVHAGSNDPYTPDHLTTRILRQVPQPEPPIDTDVRIYVWMLGPDGPDYVSKTITVPTWDEVGVNYPSQVGTELDGIMADTSPWDRGKIILWHGVPGTGKTSAIRTLMRQWKDWCSFHYVADPERMFSHPGYLLQVAATSNNDPRLVICEDTGQFLKSDASDQSGAAMGRLLNFSDGILGQGSNVMFLMTTNEDISVLHPAVTRPGRCYQNLEFPAFDEYEAAEWLDNAGIDTRVAGSMTLAELIAIQKSNSANSLQLDSAGV